MRKGVSLYKLILSDGKDLYKIRKITTTTQQFKECAHTHSSGGIQWYPAIIILQEVKIKKEVQYLYFCV